VDRNLSVPGNACDPVPLAGVTRKNNSVCTIPVVRGFDNPQRPVFAMERGAQVEAFVKDLPQRVGYRLHVMTLPLFQSGYHSAARLFLLLVDNSGN
jgi:hypothetical protein